MEVTASKSEQKTPVSPQHGAPAGSLTPPQRLNWNVFPRHGKPLGAPESPVLAFYRKDVGDQITAHDSQRILEGETGALKL